jgi:hypothetical protein
MPTFFFDDGPHPFARLGQWPQLEIRGANAPPHKKVPAIGNSLRFEAFLSRAMIAFAASGNRSGE